MLLLRVHWGDALQPILDVLRNSLPCLPSSHAVKRAPAKVAPKQGERKPEGHKECPETPNDAARPTSSPCSQ